jgi:ubiquinone biosynthesis protein
MATALRRAYESYRTGEAVFRDAGRFRQILTVLIRHGFGALVQQLNLGDRWGIAKLVEKHLLDEAQLPIERRILLAIHDLGPTFVKLGQILSTRPDLLPPALIEELTTLQDDVPPMSFAQVQATIREELGGDIEELFAEFSPQPLACASIAQVHRARLHDGSDVVVKVQRPGLRPQIEADLEIMSFLARALESSFPEARLYSPAGIVEQFERAIRKEIDFSNELENIERFRANFRGNDRVHFPRPHRERSSARVLTMERIAGRKVTEVDPQAVDAERVIRAGIDAVLQMIYVDGFFHGDLHPGNLLVRDDGTLCFLDFGLCGRLMRRQREQLVDMLIALVNKDFAGVARLFWRFADAEFAGERDYDAFESDVTECLQRRFADKTIEEIEFGAFFRDLIELALRHHVRLPPDYTMTFKALVTMEGVAKQLVPHLDMLAAARPYVTTLVAERYDPRRLAQNGYELLRDLSESVGDLQGATRLGIDYLRAAERQLRRESNRVEDLRRTYALVQRNHRTAALAAVAALCGTLALDHDGARIFGLSVVSLFFYAGAAILGAAYGAGRRREP